MKRPRFSVTVRRLLLRLFFVWAEPWIKAYQEPKREGTPKGEKIGLSRSKFACALLQSLHGPFSLPELSQASFELKYIKGLNLTGASTALMKSWRTEKRFQDKANYASQNFSNFMIAQLIKHSSEDIIQLLLSEALVLLPGFDITDNMLIDEIKSLIKLIDKFEQSNSHGQLKIYYKTLDKYLFIYGNIIDMIKEYSLSNEIKQLENKVMNGMGDIGINVERLIGEGKSSGIISNDDADLLFAHLARIGLRLFSKEIYL